MKTPTRSFLKKCKWHTWQKLLLCVVVLGATCFKTSAQYTGQRPQRANINTLTNTELQKLAQYISEWISRDLINHHGDDFQEIHSTEGFLRFHRDHLFSLDEYIGQQVNYQAPLYPCPMWVPHDGTVTYYNTTCNVPWYFNGFEPPVGGGPPAAFNNIDADCNTCSTGLRNNFTGYNPANPNVQLPPSLTLPSPVSGIYPRTGLCSITNAAQLSDEIEGDYFVTGVTGYHNLVHGTLGGYMNGTQSAAAVLLFWPWHAWVDNIWGQWDCKCKLRNGETVNPDRNGNNTLVTGAYTLPEGLQVGGSMPSYVPGMINATTKTLTWGDPNNRITVQGKIEILPGWTLEITGGQVVEFLDNRFTEGWDGAGIVVYEGNGTDPGGTLIVDGATLGGITTMGYEDPNYTAPVLTQTRRDPNNAPSYRSSMTVNSAPPLYNCRWGGICVFGVPSLPATSNQYGRVIIRNNSLIRDAIVAVESNPGGNGSRGGGIIQASNSTFRNNRRSISIMNYVPLISGTWDTYITDCTFSSNGEPLHGFVEGIAKGAVDPIITGRTAYFMHHQGYGIKDFVVAWNTPNFDIRGNTMNNATELEHLVDKNLGVAIQSIDASYSVEKSKSSFMVDPNCATIQIPTGQGNIISNMDVGINYGSNLLDKRLRVLNNTFTNVTRAIYTNTEDEALIYGNEFEWDGNLNYQSNLGNPVGIFSVGSRGFNVRDNDFFWRSTAAPLTVGGSPVPYLGVRTNNSSSGVTYSPLIKGNEFTNQTATPDIAYGNYIEGNNWTLDIHCNQYADLQSDWYLATGANLKNQSKPGNADAGNNFTRLASGASYMNILNNGNPFFYYTDAVDLSGALTPPGRLTDKYPSDQLQNPCPGVLWQSGGLSPCDPPSVCGLYGGEGSTRMAVNLNPDPDKKTPMEMIYSGEFSESKAYAQSAPEEERELILTVANLFESGRNYTSMSKNEIDALKSIASTQTSPGKYAQTVLSIFTDEKIIDRPVETTLIASGVAENSKPAADKRFKLYPNPASSKVQIEYELKAGTKSAELELYDILGQLVLTQHLASDAHAADVNVSQLKPGTYMYSLRADQENLFNGKLVLVR
jgi:hypothetical protein